MRKIVYYVATSIDGFISALDEDVSGFVGRGNGVDRYLSDLSRYDTVIMGRKTYEFGYKFGVKPGQAPYPNMTNYVFSNTLEFEDQDPNLHVKAVDLNEIQVIKEQAGSDIYLCGGGTFAGWLIDHHQIDVLRIKLNPLLLGQGVRMFGDSRKSFRTELVDHDSYEHGLQIITYDVIYPGANG